MFSDAPPSSNDVTTSRTCRDSTEVKTLTSSGMMAPARVPQEMIMESFHHSEPSPRPGMISRETMKVRMIETNEVIQTSEVRGASKFISSELAYFALAMASFRKYETELATSIMMRITKIQTSSSTWICWPRTPRRIKVISA